MDLVCASSPEQIDIMAETIQDIETQFPEYGLIYDDLFRSYTNDADDIKC